MSGKPVNVKPVLVHLTHYQHDQLQRLKERTGAPISESVRRAVASYLKRMTGAK